MRVETFILTLETFVRVEKFPVVKPKLFQLVTRNLPRRNLEWNRNYFNFQFSRVRVEPTVKLKLFQLYYSELLSTSINFFNFITRNLARAENFSSNKSAVKLKLFQTCHSVEINYHNFHACERIFQLVTWNFARVDKLSTCHSKLLSASRTFSRVLNFSLETFVRVELSSSNNLNSFSNFQTFNFSLETFCPRRELFLE